MKSNFEIFPEEYKIFEEIGKAAEANVYNFPNVSLMKSRQFIEHLATVILKFNKIEVASDNLANKFRALRDYRVLSKEVYDTFNEMRIEGNDAVHNAYFGNVKLAEKRLQFIFHMSRWFINIYIDENQKFEEFSLKTQKEYSNFYEKLKKMEKIEAETKEKIANQAEELVRTNEQINNLEEQLSEKEKEWEEKYKKLLASIADQDKEGVEVYRERSRVFEEKEAREVIDRQLKEAGWIVDSENINNKTNKTLPEENKNMAIAEWKCGTGYADYALFIGLELVGIIEAKKTSKEVSSDLEQAKEYSRNVENRPEINELKKYGDYKVPFIYSANGREYIKQQEDLSGIWFWDARRPKEYSRAMMAWHSPEDLKQKLVAVDRETAAKKLEEDDFIPLGVREYQAAAIKSIEEALVQGRRKMLVAMATGTGKTRMALALIYRLLTTKTVRRVLFLVDRKSLGNQVYDSIKEAKISGRSMSSIYGVKGIDDTTPEIETKIHIATVQGLVKRIFHQEDASKVPSIGTYDFIIVDEAHRGYTEDKDMSEEELEYADADAFQSQYRKVIDYFDAQVVGLTATPALHTTEIFGAPIYSYSYATAVEEGFLVNYDTPYLIETALSKAGIHLDKNEKVNVWNIEKATVDSAYLNDEVDFEVTDFNKKIIVEDFNRVVIRELITMENYDDKSAVIDPNSKFKTLVFAANNLHADSIVRIFKEEYSKIGKPIDDDAIIKITSSIKDPEKAIKKFKNETYPNIVVTVDLLTTGVDVPSIANLVFLRRVKSRILYEQMLGRATRKDEDRGKDIFRIYDAVGIYESLEEVSNMKQIVKNPSRSLEDSLVDALSSKEADEFVYRRREFLAKLQRRKMRLSEKQKEEIEEVLNIRSYDRYLEDLAKADIDKFKSLEKDLNYLVTVKAEEKYGPVISTAKDSIAEVRRGYGDGNDRPEDYLEDFTAFIKLNQDKIDAIKLVVTKPSDLTRADIEELRNELTRNNFRKEDLNSAWKSIKNVDLTADIVAFVRQAALDVPLFDKAEKVDTIITKIKGLKEWNNQQIDFIEKIGKQLVASDMIIQTVDDLKEYRSFKLKGEYKKIKEVFSEEDLSTIITMINTNLYA